MSLELIQLGDLIFPAPHRRAGDGHYPVLSMTMRGGLVDQSEKFKKRVASADTSQYKVVRRNELVVGFPIDEGVLSFQNRYEEAIVSPAYTIWRLVPQRAIEPRYLERFLRSPKALNYYKSKMRGSTARRRNLPADLFRNVRVPVPGLAEQRRIAEVLDRADALRAKRRAALAQLDELTQSIFLDMFGDPATNPHGWPTAEVGTLGAIVTGNTPPRGNASLYGSTIEWIKSDNIDPPNPYLTPAMEGLSEAGRRKARVAPVNSLLVTCIAGSPSVIGNVAIANREVAFNQQINALIPVKADPLFLYSQIRLGKRLVQRASTGGMKGMVSKSRFERIRLITPPNGLQREFANRFRRVASLTERYRKSASCLDDFFASLQHRAFRGEL